jgi:hypothetical protein
VSLLSPFERFASRSLADCSLPSLLQCIFHPRIDLAQRLGAHARWVRVGKEVGRRRRSLETRLLAFDGQPSPAPALGSNPWIDNGADRRHLELLALVVSFVHLLPLLISCPVQIAYFSRSSIDRLQQSSSARRCPTPSPLVPPSRSGMLSTARRPLFSSPRWRAAKTRPRRRTLSRRSLARSSSLFLVSCVPFLFLFSWSAFPLSFGLYLYL